MIVTESGRRIDPIKFSKQDFNINDMARVLSNMVRFGGHITKFYSVAEHSIFVSQELLKQYNSYELSLVGLLHECDEYVLTMDIPSPIKDDFLYCGYTIHEIAEKCIDAMCQSINTEYNLSISSDLFEDSRLKHMDKAMCRCESVALRNLDLPDYPGVINISPVCLLPEQAYNLFLDRFEYLIHELTKNRQNGKSIRNISRAKQL